MVDLERGLYVERTIRLIFNRDRNQSAGSVVIEIGRRPSNGLGVGEDREFWLATRTGLLCGVDARTDRKWTI